MDLYEYYTKRNKELRKCKLIKFLTLGLVNYSEAYAKPSDFQYKLYFDNPIRKAYSKLVDYRLHKELPKWQAAISKNDNWWTKGYKFGINTVSPEVMAVMSHIAKTNSSNEPKQ